MGANRKSVRFTIEGTDMMVSVFPEDGEVRVTSGKFILEPSPDGTARDKGHTLIITRDRPNPDARADEIKRRPTHHITLDHEVREV